MIPLTDRYDGNAWSGRTRDIQAEALCIDGTPLAALDCWLTDARLGDAAPATAYGDMPGRAGGIDRTLEGPCGEAVPGRRPCEFDIATDCDAADRAWTRFALGAYLGKTVEVLYAPLQACLRGRLSAGPWSDSNGISTCTLALDAEPYALGGSKTSTGYVVVEGSAWAEPVLDITVETARPNIDVALDGLRVMRIPSASGNFPAGARLTVDAAAHAVKVNGNPACPTLDSDWPVLTPGPHKVACDGCDIRIAWRERYMF